jgi:hypothetical protein
MPESFAPLIWETFVVRVWRESSSGAWRGEVVHLPDRAAVHFAAFAQAEEFMQRYVAHLEADPPYEASDSAA